MFFTTTNNKTAFNNATNTTQINNGLSEIHSWAANNKHFINLTFFELHNLIKNKIMTTNELIEMFDSIEQGLDEPDSPLSPLLKIKNLSQYYGTKLAETVGLVNNICKDENLTKSFKNEYYLHTQIEKSFEYFILLINYEQNVSFTNIINFLKYQITSID